MSNLGRLKIDHLPGGKLQPNGRLMLPVAVERAAYGAVAADDLYLWINGPNMGETTVIAISQALAITTVATLDVVTAGVLKTAAGFVMTGSDKQGQAVVQLLQFDGQISWRQQMSGAQPVNWPKPYCRDRPVILWQTEANQLRIASITATGFGETTVIPVGPAPLSVGQHDNSLYLIWVSGGRIEGVAWEPAGTHLLSLPLEKINRAALGSQADVLMLGWRQQHDVLLAPFDDIDHMQAINLGKAKKGKLRIISGPQAVVWAQDSVYDLDEALLLLSALGLPGEKPIELEGFVADVLWWQDQLVVVASQELCFFKLHAAEG